MRDTDTDGDSSEDDVVPLEDVTTEAQIEVVCPHCGEVNEIAIDPGGGPTQEYVEDCQVCCNPWSVTVRFDDDGTAQVFLDTLDA